MARYDWFRIYNEARNDRKLDTLNDREFRCWFNLMCMASEAKSPRGTVPSMAPEVLALEAAHGDRKSLDSCLTKCAALGMIDVQPDGALQIVKWAARQYDKPSDVPEAVSERVARHRNAEKRDVTRSETPCNAEKRAETPPPSRARQRREEERREEETPPSPSLRSGDPPEGGDCGAAPKKNRPNGLQPAIDYFIAQGSTEDLARRWWDHNLAVGWVTGKARAPVRDWQASARTWIANEAQFGVKRNRNAPGTATLADWAAEAEEQLKEAGL